MFHLHQENIHGLLPFWNFECFFPRNKFKQVDAWSLGLVIPYLFQMTIEYLLRGMIDKSTTKGKSLLGS